MTVTVVGSLLLGVSGILRMRQFSSLTWMASASLTSETEKRTGRRFAQISRRYARLEDVLIRGRAALPLLFAFSLYATSPLAPTLGVTASSLWVMGYDAVCGKAGNYPASDGHSDLLGVVGADFRHGVFLLSLTR